MGNSQATPPPVATPEPEKVIFGRSGKKICCSCPDTKKLRDECIVMNGEDACAQQIKAHKMCLRLEGFTVKD